METLDQVSAGGVVCRDQGTSLEVVLISVGDPVRWQLPKGIVDSDETPEQAALREVREEAGVSATIIAPLAPVEYWYVGSRGKRRVRFHKVVHFFVMQYAGGDVADHDHEVNEARWVSVDQAQQMLAFKGEKQAVAQAAAQLGRR
jgi:8-oxo-dGTP pyrophosphatase MutT (NUDIX family)